MGRKEFSRSVRVAAVKRAMKNGEVYCEECGVLTKGKFQIDHINPDGLTGEPTLENAKVICVECHARKTKVDVANIAKAKRREARALGVAKGTGTLRNNLGNDSKKIISAGFPKSQRNKSLASDLPPLPRRSLYQ